LIEQSGMGVTAQPGNSLKIYTLDAHTKLSSTLSLITAGAAGGWVGSRATCGRSWIAAMIFLLCTNHSESSARGVAPRGKVRIASARHEMEFSALGGPLRQSKCTKRATSRPGCASPARHAHFLSAAFRARDCQQNPPLPLRPARRFTPKPHINTRRPAFLTSAFAPPFLAPFGIYPHARHALVRLCRAVNRRPHASLPAVRSWAGHGRPTQHPASHRPRLQRPQHVEQQQHHAYRNQSCHWAAGFKRRHHG
jgi:hypothetical protein